MNEHTIVEFQNPAFRDELTEVLRQGAQRLIKEAVQAEHVPLQAEPDGAAEHRQGPERRRPHPVVVTGDLLLRGSQVERVVNAPDVRLEQLRRAVPRTVRQQHDILGHGPACGELGYFRT